VFRERKLRGTSIKIAGVSAEKITRNLNQDRRCPGTDLVWAYLKIPNTNGRFWHLIQLVRFINNVDEDIFVILLFLIILRYFIIIIVKIC
jgi:hypothetical protein